MLHLEKRFSNNVELRESYTKMMHEAIELKHLRLCNENEIGDEKSYFMPHHAV